MKHQKTKKKQVAAAPETKRNAEKNSRLENEKKNEIHSKNKALHIMNTHLLWFKKPIEINQSISFLAK